MGNKTELMAVAGVASGITALGIALVAIKKLSEVNKALSNAISKIEDGIEVDISEDLVREATERAVEKAANNAASAAVTAVRNEFHQEIRSEVRHAVEKEKTLMRDDIKSQIKKEVGYIDISDAKKEVLEEAKQEVMDHLNENLDLVLAEHNKELEHIQKIYGNLANTLKGGVA